MVVIYEIYYDAVSWHDYIDFLWDMQECAP